MRSWERAYSRLEQSLAVGAPDFHPYFAAIRKPASKGGLSCFGAMYIGLTNPPQFAQPLRYFGCWERARLAMIVAWCASHLVGHAGQQCREPPQDKT